MHIHLIHWFINFIGVNNGENAFSTHMYNFWSGFGGNISILALIGTVFGVYRHNLSRIDKRLEAMNPLRHLVHKKDKDA
jgi:hypothetical protein